MAAGFILGALIGGGVGWLIGSERVEVRKKNPVPSDFKPGELVYFDSFAGLVPAKFLHLGAPGENTAILVTTAARGPYKKKEIVEARLNSVVKRSWVHRRGGKVKIIEPRRQPNRGRQRNNPFPVLPTDPFATRH